MTRLTRQSNIERSESIKDRLRKSGPESAVVFCRIPKIGARYGHDPLSLCDANDRSVEHSLSVCFVSAEPLEHYCNSASGLRPETVDLSRLPVTKKWACRKTDTGQ